MSTIVGLGVLSIILTIASSFISRTASIIRFAHKPVVLRVKKPGDEKQIEHISLPELLETRCPSLFSDFIPAWWLFNGHLQTIYCVLGDFSKIDHVIYRRKYIRLADSGTLGLDFTNNTFSCRPDNTPVIVVMHGLTGGSYEAYVRAILSKACAATDDGGLEYRAVVINFRGCAKVPMTSPQGYSAGHTDDLRQALIYISHMFPEAPLLGIGFSLGANVMTRYVAEEGGRSRLQSCCALGCPWDLFRNNISILSTFLGRQIYSRGMGNNLTNMVKKNYKGLTSDPNHIAAKAADAVMMLKNPLLNEFDQTFTSKVGGSMPPFPFESADDYYRWASSHYVINDIRVPYLAISANDDPVVRHVPLDAIESGFVAIKLTAGGGHLGWFQSGPRLSVDRWTTKPVLEWFKLTGDDVIHAPNGASSIFQDDDGFLREESRPHLGCKEIQDGGILDWTAGDVGILQGL